MKWPRLAFAVLILVVAPMFVVTQFTHKQQPTQILQPVNSLDNTKSNCGTLWLCQQLNRKSEQIQ